MDADEIIRLLGLECLPAEGGFFRETWRSAVTCGNRASGTAIYYLITDDPEGFSAFHSLGFDELYHFYAGDPVELYLLERGKPAAPSLLGIDLAAGQRPQALVPAGRVQGARLASGGRWALLGTTMAPGFDPRDFGLSRCVDVLAAYPESALLIKALTRP